MVPPTSFMGTLSLLSREAVRSARGCLGALRRQSEVEIDTPSSDARDPVLVLGGFLSHPIYYAPLGRMLTRRGYAVHFDDVFNACSFRAHVESLAARVDRIVQATGAPLRIVGHSLGGIHAMALVAERPEAVCQVIAVASPVAGGTPWRPLQSLAERILQVSARDAQTLEHCIAPFADRITTISSPHDAIAPPGACAVAGATNVVLQRVPRSDRSLVSHGGVIFMRSAIRTIFETLARSLTPATLPLGAMG